MTSSDTTQDEAMSKLHSAIRAAAFLNKHSHALETSILRRTIVQGLADDLTEQPVAYCSSCDARTVGKCLQLLARLNSSELHEVVKKTAKALSDDKPKAAATQVKTGFKPSLECKRRPMGTNFSYAKMKKVVREDMLQNQNKTTKRTLREAAFFNLNGSLGAGPKKLRSTKGPLKIENGKQKQCDVAGNMKVKNPQVSPTIQFNGNSQTDSNQPVPQVKLDQDGQIVVDPLSLIVPMPPLGGDRGPESSTRNVKWPIEETVKFYEALHRYGTDFSLMLSAFTNRTRNNLKRKFKFEDKKNQKLVDVVMKNGCTASDLLEVTRQLKIQNDLKLITRANKL